MFSMFSKYKILLDEDVQRAVMLACMTKHSGLCGGCYCICKGRLLIGLNCINDLSDECVQPGLLTLAENLPPEYNNKFDVCTIAEYEKRVPEKVFETSGYFSLYHPEASRPKISTKN